jgi:hypothetical protein
MYKLKIIASLLLIFGFQQSIGQGYRFKTSSITMSLLNPKGNWTKWTEPKETNIIISLDTKKNRIVVYSEAIQLFEIMEYIEEKSTPNDNTVSFVCRDNDGEDCNIAIITRKKQENRLQLYITYEDKIINYNLELLD